jgi:hypothetical protein
LLTSAAFERTESGHPVREQYALLASAIIGLAVAITYSHRHHRRTRQEFFKLSKAQQTRHAFEGRFMSLHASTLFFLAIVAVVAGAVYGLAALAFRLYDRL